MGHGTVADEIKGRAAHRRGARRARSSAIDEEGVRFRSYIDGARAFMAPETSMEVQAALGSDIALVFDECLPFHVTASTPRARRSARTAGWTAASPGTPRTGRTGRASTGSSRAASTRSCAAARAGGRRARARSASRSAARSGEDKAQMYEVVGWTTEELPEERPRHLLGIGDVDDLLRGVELGIDTFDCAMPTRHRPPRHGDRARPGAALARRPGQGPLTRRPTSRSGRAARARPARRGYRRAYLHYLFRRREPTGARLVTLHNLAYLAAADGRAARRDRRRPLAEAVAAVARRRGAVARCGRSATSCCRRSGCWSCVDGLLRRCPRRLA